MQTGRVLAVFILLMMLSSCKQPVKQAASPQDTAAPSAPSAAPLAPARPAPAKPPAPPLKAHASVAAAKLGTLPEGVGLPVGSRVPDVELKTHLGKPIRLAQLVKTGPRLLIFYRGGW